ncbi:hypothetical protein [Streptomyces sp. NPDC007991]|uniref:hypothetical protein n=1 Tax=Streptomyces sp. NPDC007991 TaxID=3364803 RepID=UPI0036E01F91
MATSRIGGRVTPVVPPSAMVAGTGHARDRSGQAQGGELSFLRTLPGQPAFRRIASRTRIWAMPRTATCGCEAGQGAAHHAAGGAELSRGDPGEPAAQEPVWDLDLASGSLQELGGSGTSPRYPSKR